MHDPLPEPACCPHDTLGTWLFRGVSVTAIAALVAPCVLCACMPPFSGRALCLGFYLLVWCERSWSMYLRGGARRASGAAGGRDWTAIAVGYAYVLTMGGAAVEFLVRRRTPADIGIVLWIGLACYLAAAALRYACLHALRHQWHVDVSRPFDRDRDGGVLGEGAGVMVIESLSHARARGARLWLEICGGASFPDPRGAPTAAGLGVCMALALANARLRPEEIDYVCAHGPSDPLIDHQETLMLRETLGRHAYRIPVSSIKGVTGNPLSAAGPLELAACALAIRHECVPPTANYTTPDPDCDLDYVPQARVGRIGYALVNLHGMGGGNTTLVVRRPPA